jgi:pimeloyl-ACP methyl ester carboxylesterase
MNRAVFAFCLMLFSVSAGAVALYDVFPETINPDERYVIYSHGFIVEGKDPRPEHPAYGVYEFAAIRQALFEDGGFNLIAHHRPAGADVGEYVPTLVSWVDELLRHGVEPSRITLVGFSRGALLTAHASSRRAAVGLNTALMGICSAGTVSARAALSLGGNLLSIYETSDFVGTCESLANDSSGLISFREFAIATGLGHGAFFKPLPEWLEPLRQWIAETNR